MRIALWSIGYFHGFGGAEQMVNTLIRRFSMQGVQTFLIADGNPRSKPYHTRFAPLPEEVLAYVDTFPNPLLCKGPVSFLSSLVCYAQGALRLVSFLRRNTPEIVHLHLVTLDVFLLILYKLLFKYRLVITFRGGELSVAKQSRMARLKIRIGLCFADAVTSVSQQMASCLRKHFGNRRVLWIPNGVDQRELRLAAQSVGPLIPPDHFVFAGRLHADKRVPFLVEIFRSCIEAGCNRNLYIIGDGEEREKVTQYISRHRLGERVILLGAMSRQKVLSIIARARCLLLSSSNEGCPNVVLEAMALSIPVIAASVGGVPELVVHGNTGYLFPPDEPDAAMAHILRLDRDRCLALALGRAGAELAQQKFDLTATVESYLLLYRSVLEKTLQPASSR